MYHEKDKYFKKDNSRKETKLRFKTINMIAVYPLSYYIIILAIIIILKIQSMIVIIKLVVLVACKQRIK